jgi:hypothetical protein
MEKTMAEYPLIPVTEQQRAHILELRQRGLTSREISQAMGGNPTPGQVAAIIAHGTMGTYAGEAAATPEMVDAIDAKIGLERDLERALRANIDQVEPGLKIADGGKQKTVESGGRIDILAEDATGAKTVIELKVATADRDAISQILQYMGDLKQTVSTVRGIIVAADFAPPAIAAGRAAPNVRLLRYRHRFSFEAIDV